MDIELTREERNTAIEAIKSYFECERGEEIGTLAAELLLDFFVHTIGPAIYNGAVGDARRWFMKKMEDIDIDYSLLLKSAPPEIRRG